MDVDVVQPIDRRGVGRRTVGEALEGDATVDRRDVVEGIAGDRDVGDAIGSPRILDYEATVLGAVGGEGIADVLEGIAGDGRMVDAVERQTLAVEGVALDGDAVEARDVEVSAAAGMRVDDVDGTARRDRPQRPCR